MVDRDETAPSNTGGRDIVVLEMSAGRRAETRRAKARWTTGGSGIAGALCAAAGALVAACSSNDGPAVPSFAAEDCHGQLVTLAIFPDTAAPLAIPAWATSNNLALDGDTLFVMYAFANATGALPPSGGIVAVPVSGGSTSIVGAAENTSQWLADSFWVAGGEIHMQTGPDILSVPTAPATPSTLPITLFPGTYAAYAHDADFGYSAHAGEAQDLTVTKTPIAGGAPTVLVDEQLPTAVLGGMADAGDAVLLQVSWHPAVSTSTGDFTRVWRIPKDGSPRTEVRPDVAWSDPLSFQQWLAWDGEDVIAPISVQHEIGQARVAPGDTSSPQPLKLRGTVATRRGDEILSFQTLLTRDAHNSTSTRLLIASSKGAPAGSVVACGQDDPAILEAVPAGIAAGDDAIYVSYRADSDLVIARVVP